MDGVLCQRIHIILPPRFIISNKLHIGNSYTTVLPCLARFKGTGYDVRFLTGTDEHGQKIQRSAAAKARKDQDFMINSCLDQDLFGF